MDGILDNGQKIQLYLEYFNNYLTVSKFAEHYGLTEYMASDILKQGKEILNKQHEG